MPRPDVRVTGIALIYVGFQESRSGSQYAQGSLLRERFLPRVREADRSTYVTEAHDNLDPFRLWDIMMANEKPGGHGERSVAVGVIDKRCIPHGGHQFALNIAAGREWNGRFA